MRQNFVLTLNSHLKSLSIASRQIPSKHLPKILQQISLGRFARHPNRPDPPWQVRPVLQKFSSHMLENVSSQQLAKAAALKEGTENLGAELSQLLGGSSTATAETSARFSCQNSE